MKRCFKCGETKALTEFYRHSEMADGHLGKCKECSKRDTKNNPRKVAIDKKRSATKKRKAWCREALRRHRARYAEKDRARRMVTQAVRAGRLKKEPCVRCGSVKSQAHHPDYSKPLEVIWLCEKHHKQLHKSAA